MVVAKRWERQAQRVGSRNGTYLRRLIPSMGAVALGPATQMSRFTWGENTDAAA